MKKKVVKGLFIISFLPFVFLIIFALYNAIVGYDVYTMILPTYVKTIYGIEAFKEVLFWYGLSFIIIPVLPVCFIYQVVYSVYLKKKMKLNRS